MKAEEIVGLIEEAFRDVKRPEFSLRQFKVIDDYGMSGELTAEEYNRLFDQAGLNREDQHWTNISYNLIEECGNQLAHMEADAFCYYLPAYMKYSVNHYLDTLNFIVECTVFSLDISNEYFKDDHMQEYVYSKISMLTKKQKACIVKFLEFMAQNPRDNDAHQALDGFWYRYLGDTE